MTHAGYVFAGWGLGLAVIGLYAWSVLRRGRALSRHVAPERRRWMTSDGDAVVPGDIPDTMRVGQNPSIDQVTEPS